MAIDYVKAAATALRLITANGGPVDLVKLDRVPADGAKPWRAGGATDTTVSVQAVLLSYDETDIDGDIVRRGDRKALVAFTDANSTVAELAAQFTAANSEFLSVPSNASLQTGDIDFAVSGWIYNDSQANGRLYVTKGTGFAVQEYSLFNSAGTSYSLRLQNGSISITAPSFTGAWDFIVFWHDSVANTVSIQVNGGAIISAAYSGGVIASTDPFNLGGSSSGASHDGRMQGVTFHKRTLTASERTWLYNAGAGRHFCEYGSDMKTDLISYWILNESGGTRFDSHGSNDLADNSTVTIAPGLLFKCGADVLLFDDLIEQSGGKWRIENIDLLDPTGANGILYTLQLRR